MNGVDIDFFSVMVKALVKKFGDVSLGADDLNAVIGHAAEIERIYRAAVDQRGKKPTSK